LVHDFSDFNIAFSILGQIQSIREARNIEKVLTNMLSGGIWATTCAGTIKKLKSLNQKQRTSLTPLGEFPNFDWSLFRSKFLITAPTNKHV